MRVLFTRYACGHNVQEFTYDQQVDCEKSDCGANPKRSFHGRRALNAQAVQRLIADQPAGNSGSDCSAISAAVADEYNVITY
ncbi:unnamed protein product [Rhizoctonia solani]|nr:unnamed protein product [Rhizoctonia solani]